MPQRLDSTLQKGLQILEILATSHQSLGITELSLMLKLNKSNVHRLVKTLFALGYVNQDSTRRYKASFKLWKLGSSTMSHLNIAHLCAGEMKSLSQKSGESTHLSVLDGLQTLYIDKIDSAQPVRAYTERGGNAPLHCVATGKVLLAYNYKTLRAPISRMLQKFTPRTIVSIKALDAEMDRILNNGYAINLGEYRADVGGLAAPIFDHERRVVAALGISGPVSRLSPAKIKEFSSLVSKAAKSITSLIEKS